MSEPRQNSPLKEVLDDILSLYPHASPAEIRGQSPDAWRELEAAYWRDRVMGEFPEAVAEFEPAIIYAFQIGDTGAIGTLVADALSRYIAHRLEETIQDYRVDSYLEGVDSVRDWEGYEL